VSDKAIASNDTVTVSANSGLWIDATAAARSTFGVSVDGTQIGNTEAPTATTAAGIVQTLAFEGQLSGGSHQIDISQFKAPAIGSTPNIPTIHYDGTLQGVMPNRPDGHRRPGPRYRRLEHNQWRHDEPCFWYRVSGDYHANQMALMAAGTHAIETDAARFTLEVAGGSAALTNFNRRWLREN
jgi:hypothetical protein